MHSWIRKMTYDVFMKIAEPRTVRVINFLIYLSLVTAGIKNFFDPPSHYQDVISLRMIYIFAAFLLLGSLVAMFAVLPGVWWLERTGILAIVTGMSIYMVVIVELDTSPLGVSMCFSFILFFILRWMEIRRYQLAPREE